MKNQTPFLTVTVLALLVISLAFAKEAPPAEAATAEVFGVELPVVENKDGSQRISLRDVFRPTATAKLDENGEVVVKCVTSSHEMDNFVRGQEDDISIGRSAR